MANSNLPWESYWESNQSANSFAFDYSTKDGPYGVVNAFWQQTFSQFTNTNTVVDLGAGNGALADLFLQSRKVVNCKKWINIDSAKAKPLVKHKIITQLQDDMHNLSLADASVDHFISMFGIEYADFEQTFYHVKRCLSDDGRFHFVMHHKDSLISIQSRITISVCERFLQSGLLTSLDNFTNLDRLKTHLLYGLKSQLHQSELSEQEDVQLIGQNIYFILNAASDLAESIKKLELLSTEIQWQVLRLKQQLSAANQVSTVNEYLLSHDLTDYSIKELTYQEDVLAHAVSGTRSKIRNKNA